MTNSNNLTNANTPEANANKPKRRSKADAAATNSVTPPESLPFPDPTPGTHVGTNLNAPESNTFENTPEHTNSGYANSGYATFGQVPSGPATFEYANSRTTSGQKFGQTPEQTFRQTPEQTFRQASGQTAAQTSEQKFGQTSADTPSDSTSLPTPPATFVTGGTPNFAPNLPPNFPPNFPPAAPAKKRSSLVVGILSGICSAAAVGALFVGALNFGWIPVNSGSTTINFGSNDTVTSEELINRANTSLSNPNWEAVARATGDAVVSISVTTASGTGQGSGAIIDSAGYIITNNHVIEDAREIQVTLLNGSIITAEIVGTDPTTDLAIIKISVDQELTALKLDKSSELTVGQPILAIGNPLGYANSVSTGVISALDRPIAVAGESSVSSETIVTNAIQIDAAINPGNSGGPLFDGNGNIVGITSAIATTSGSGGSVGIGFAIPADLANKVAQQLIKNGTVVHAQVGIMIMDGSASIDGVQKNGALIDSFAETGNAKSSGLQVQDLIVAIDGKTVINAIAFMGAIHTYLPDEVVNITVIRNGNLVNIEVELTEAQPTVTIEPTPEYNTPEENQNSPWFFDPFSW
jgi:putative serine protease PepD